MKEHRVRPGDCLTSIAYENGFFWQTIWEHAANAALREKRKDPFALLPGEDAVTIPDVRAREEQVATGKRHRFRRRGVPAKLKLRLLNHEGEPRAGEEYFLEIDGEIQINGRKTDADGRIEEFIRPNAKEGRLFLRGGEEVYDLEIGHLPPALEIAGAQARLANLGFYPGPRDGADSPQLEQALQRFREQHGIDASASRDEVFAAIENAHKG